MNEKVIKVGGIVENVMLYIKILEPTRISSEDMYKNSDSYMPLYMSKLFQYFAAQGIL
jgi:hypothetical protein